MPETESEPEESKKQSNSLLKTWTPDDTKLLAITAIATMAANVVTVILVALAIIVARSFRPNPGTPGNYVFLAIPSILMILGTGLIISRRSFKRDESENIVSLWFSRIVNVLIIFSALLYTLAWIGFAVGIK
jgi:small-conductance mechanosensitive channel